jgi:hypothetical protein
MLQCASWQPLLWLCAMTTSAMHACSICMPSTMTRSIHPHPAHTHPLAPTYRSTATSPWHLCRAARTSTRSSECSRACSVTCGSAAWQVGNVRVGTHRTHPPHSTHAHTARCMDAISLQVHKAVPSVSGQTTHCQGNRSASHVETCRAIARCNKIFRGGRQRRGRPSLHHSEVQVIIRKKKHSTRRGAPKPHLTATSLHSRCFVHNHCFGAAQQRVLC